MIRILLVLLLLVGLAVAAQMTGLIAVNTSGVLRAPSVDLRVSGGEAPKVEVETAKVKVGVAEKTVELPKVDVGMREKEVALPTVDVSRAAADDGSTTR